MGKVGCGVRGRPGDSGGGPEGGGGGIQEEGSYWD